MSCNKTFSKLLWFLCLSSLLSPKAFSALEISGSLQLDQVKHLGKKNKDTSFSNGAVLRNFSLSLKKQMSSQWQLLADLNFSEKGSSLGPAFLIYKAQENIDLLLGQIPSPFCLENSNSSKWLPFLERSNVTSTFKPCIGPGASVHYTYQYGALKWGLRQPPLGWQKEKSSEEIRSDKWGSSLRLTAFKEQSNKNIFHLGASFSYQEITDKLTFSSSGEIKTREGQTVITTEEIAAKSFQVSAAELAYLYGPFLLQAEFLSTSVKQRENKETLRFKGWQLQTTYMLKGASQVYKQKDGVFAAPDFTLASSAWQLAARMSEINLSDQEITAGKLSSVTVALNWYIDSSLKLACNWLRSIHEKKQTKTQEQDSLALRLQTLF